MPDTQRPRDSAHLPARLIRIFSPAQHTAGAFRHGHLGAFRHGGSGAFRHGHLGAFRHGGAGAFRHGGLGAFRHGGSGGIRTRGIWGPSDTGGLGAFRHGHLGAFRHGGLGPSDTGGWGPSDTGDLGAFRHGGSGGLPTRGIWGPSDTGGLGAFRHGGSGGIPPTERPVDVPPSAATRPRRASLVARRAQVVHIIHPPQRHKCRIDVDLLQRLDRPLDDPPLSRRKHDRISGTRRMRHEARDDS